jgi:4-diphosphocytidyl-2-C-methyl-D-erythritol kinase
LVSHSYAKLNLYLAVLNKRKDNYHNIRTVFERIDLSDRIILKSRPDKKIRIICENPEVPKDSSNLCYRSARLLQGNLNISCGAEIKITKRIPVGAGLGGGSGNAAAVITGLNKLWRLNLPRPRLVQLARRIGCDVPFFIYDTSFALGEERGDRIEPLSRLKNARLWHILVVPRIKVSTPLIYKKWDANKKAGLTRPGYDVRILNLALRKNDLSLLGRALFNSLERITAVLYPEVQRIKERLKDSGVKAILMSGSGPAVFGVVSSRKEAVSLSKQLKEEEGSWQVFVTRTV